MQLGAGLLLAIQKTDIYKNMKMMMKIHKAAWPAGLILVWILAGAAPAAARVYWGVRAGVARSSLVQEIDLDYRSGSCVGYSAGLLADIPFYERFSFRPEVALIYGGGSFLSEQLGEGIFLLKHRLRTYSLQPSFNVAFNIPISGVKMAVYAGPALDFRLWNTVSTQSMLEESSFAATGKETKPFDLGVHAGISVEYKGVFFSINALAGNLYRQKEKTEGEPSVYQNNLTFSLGYFFR
jgi:hypothetical protein